MTLPDPNSTVALALAEDVGGGDLTAALISEHAQAEATVISRENAVLCGIAWFDAVFHQLDSRINTHWQAADGDRIEPNQLLCTLHGPARALLTGERTALNFLQMLSSTATLARRYADTVAGTGATILDTRKTLPGLRLAQKYAVRCGGCQNHRIGLFDAVLIKENHIMAAGSISNAIAAARRLYPGVTVEVEVETLAELDEAIAARPDIVMLDNFDLATMVEAVNITDKRVKLEASGNVNFDTVRNIAKTGVDYISIGGLTKDVRAVDLSMRFKTV
ncbi:carboxylating nicotinate-nucleotide diphosphorylase [Candidatus Contendibacter odensensis]|uniref:Probable nicotinate-nucleotide pyrophosphorylase [carboxylating] n=1 Tax=Candidatus Contendobacter odensis Run_B_J11 TaxID=1400861 RepID=A0A7U7J5J2_9GAMM|nr:carboxylating nicotinate-nucleotide diphosphorylase [Candidatus Contendobacter odensis]CDH47377.1 Nicotinate-nucleotide pyrophosphorylase (carboxylating) [Candidatus Contendobacter odensis Run_B_J11]